MSETIEAFVDASVLFAASYSATGASREVVRLAIRGAIQLMISVDVLDEAERNLAAKYPDAVDVFRLVVESTPFEIVTPSQTDVHKAAKYTASKDAHVVAAAKMSQAGYLVTLDRKHLLGQHEVAEKSRLQIVTPGDFLRFLRSEGVT